MHCRSHHPNCDRHNVGTRRRRNGSGHRAVYTRGQWLPVITLANELGPDRVANLHALSIASPELLAASRAHSAAPDWPRPPSLFVSARVQWLPVIILGK